MAYVGAVLSTKCSFKPDFRLELLFIFLRIWASFGGSFAFVLSGVIFKQLGFLFPSWLPRKTAAASVVWEGGGRVCFFGLGQGGE